MQETMLLPASGLPSGDQPLVFCQEGGGVTCLWGQGRGCCAQHLTVSRLQPILPAVARPPAPPRAPGATCSERSSSTVAALLVFSAADFRFPFFLSSSVCFRVYHTVFCSICPWRLMIKEQMKQMTEMRTLPPTSVRFQGRTRRGWGESEHICSIPRLLPDTSLQHVTLTSPCDLKLLPRLWLL